MNIFAFTQMGSKYRSYPGYVSLNERNGEVELTARSPDFQGMQSGSCPMSDEELRKLAESIQVYLANKQVVL